MADFDSIQLEPAAGFIRPDDPRPKMPEPLPVKLVAVEDVALAAPAGAERRLDEFYVGLLQFVRELTEGTLAYRADNVRLVFQVVEGPIERDCYKVVRIEVLSLADTEKRLVEAEIEYTRQRGLTPGSETLALLDPAGNWIELVEARRVM